MDYSIVQDFYNVLAGKGKFHTAGDMRANAVEMLKKSQSYLYTNNPTTVTQQQSEYDQGVMQFVSWSIREGFVKSSSILQDLTTMNEAFRTGFSGRGSGCGEGFIAPSGIKLPAMWESEIDNTEAVNFLRTISTDNHIDDIRLYCPTVRKSLLAVEKIALNIKAALKYNQGKNTDTNERTDTTMQRSCKSLQEAKCMARSEYIHDTKTRLMRLVTGQAQVLVPQRKSRKKFARFILLDWSISMQQYNRAQKAAAVLLDSIQSVVQHGDILHLAFFGRDFIYKGQVTADNTQELLIEVCNSGNYTTGTTYGAVLHTAYHLLKNDPDLAKLEIILLSDGEIFNFQPLLVDDCVVHLVKVDTEKADKKITQTIEHCRGTATYI